MEMKMSDHRYFRHLIILGIDFFVDTMCLTKNKCPSINLVNRHRFGRHNSQPSQVKKCSFRLFGGLCTAH